MATDEHGPTNVHHRGDPVAIELCKGTYTSTGKAGGHEGMNDPIHVTFMDGKRTVCGICMYCQQPIIAQEPLYNAVLAPVRAHHSRLPKGMWECPKTRIDHLAATYLMDGARMFECIDCHATLSHYRWCNNLTGEEYDLFISDYTIEEDPV
jgi:hypothetical protein